MTLRSTDSENPNMSRSLLALILAPAASFAQGGAAPTVIGGRTPNQDAVLDRVALVQRMDAQVPLDTPFRDETGRTITLRDCFRGKPVLLNLIQYRCTMLCSEEMKILAESLKQMTFDIGKQFDVVTLSIDARETPELAADYKRGYVRDYGRPGAEQGWHFLTGDKASIQRVADAIGYRFVYDPAKDQFAHPDGITVLTPQGRVARYFFRLEYPARELRLAVVEATNRRIASPTDLLALVCYHYDPVMGRYDIAFMRLVRIGGLFTVLATAGGIFLFNLRERRGARREAAAAPESEG